MVTKYASLGDGPYGDYFDFNPYFVGDDVLYFASKRVVIDADESKPYNDENEDLVITFSDSTIYKFNNGKWLGQLITPRNKPYRKEFKTYNELYPPE